MGNPKSHFNIIIRILPGYLSLSAEPIEVAFGMWSRASLGNHVLDGAGIALEKGAFLHLPQRLPPGEGAVFAGGRRHPSCGAVFFRVLWYTDLS